MKSPRRPDVHGKQCPRSPTRSRPISPTTIHYPTDVATKRSRKYSRLSLLGALSLFSVVTNIYVFYGKRQYEAGHYGLEGGRRNSMRKMDPAWSPVRRGRDDEVRWVFRDGKLTRRDHRGGDASRNERLQHLTKYHQQMVRNRTSSLPMEGSVRRGHRVTSNGLERVAQTQDHQYYVDRPEKIKGVRDNDGISRKRKGSSNRHNRQHSLKSRKPDGRTKTHNIRQQHQRQQHHLVFQPHPSRKKSQLSAWSLSLPPPTEPIRFNRLVLLDASHEVPSGLHDSTTLEDWLVESEKSGELEEEEEDLARRSQTVVWDDDQECVPMSDWQTTSHPTCNSVHEMDISLLLHDAAFSLVSNKGHWRSAWKVDVAIAEANGSLNVNSSYVPKAKSSKKHNITALAEEKYVVLKSLKYVHDPNEEVFELSRVDAVSLDVLTRSRFTINIHGFCGSSSIQEFAGHGDLKSLLPKLDSIDKLRYATWVAEGIADVHSIDLLDKSSEKRNRNDVPLIHNDINMDNILLGYRDGIDVPLLNDFNIAVFRKKDAKTGEPCRFRGRFANPQWMSPEQQEREDELSTGYLSEKIDTYALGNILYKVAVGNSPWKYEYNVTRITPEMKAKIARAKLRGAKPKLPPEVRSITDPSIKAVLVAMDRCYRNDAALRPSAKEVATYLKSELDTIEAPLKVMERFDLD